MQIRRCLWWLLLLLGQLSAAWGTRCAYGDRGSLTAICVNATASLFRTTTYRFDNLDETLVCLNCSLDAIESNTFDIAGNVIKSLELANSKIGTLKESSFVGLVFLEKLNLRDNQIKTIIPFTFRGIKKLRTLDLEHNQITSVLDGSFKELVNLRELNLQNNAIQLIDKGGFAGLGNLTALNLRNNHLREIKDVFDPLTAIEEIDLEQNRIAHLNVDDLNSSTLFRLNLAKNALKTVGDAAFADLSNLAVLDLSWNAIEALRERYFAGLRRLFSLDLESNLLSTIPTNALTGLHNLRYLQLASNRLKELKTGAFSGLPELRSLNLSSNRIKAVEKTGVLPLHSLHTLDLSTNQIIDLDYKLLIYNMPKLSLISLTGNRLPCYTIEEVRQFFSNDSIELNIETVERGSCTVVNPSLQQKNVSVDLANSIARQVIGESAQSGHNAAIYSLFTVLLLLVGVLFYAQYRVYRALNDRTAGFRTRTTSRVQLVSSDLEHNDNDNDNDNEFFNSK